MNFVDVAIGDADIILYVTDVVEKRDKNRAYIEKLNQVTCPVIIAVNKIDISNQETVQKLIQSWSELVPKAEIFPVSALEKFNLDNIFDRIVELLPVSPPWYDKETFTDKSMRFFASEIIREKILINYEKVVKVSAYFSGGKHTALDIEPVMFTCFQNSRRQGCQLDCPSIVKFSINFCLHLFDSSFQSGDHGIYSIG